MNETQIEVPIYYHPNQNTIFSHPAKVKIVPKGRRFGLTKGLMNFAIESLLGGIESILWVDTVLTNIDRYVERYGLPVLKNLPADMWKWRSQKKELSIIIGNKKSWMDMRSADRPENIEGFGYHLIILNEAGIILADRYLWENAISPMILDHNPDIIIGGTPKGPGLFRELAIRAQDPDRQDWAYFHYTSYDNPFLDKSVIDEMVNNLPEVVKKQEIEAEFLDEAASVFKNVDKCTDSKESEPLPERSYYAGIDLAKHVDFTVISILDDLGNQVYFNRLNKLDWPYQKRLIISIIKKYNATILIDSTGVGDPIFDDLLEAGLNIEGYKFSNESKKKLIENLMISFEMARIKILPNQVQKNELDIFGYEISKTGKLTYSAPEGFHDDCVIALALADWCFRNIRNEVRIWSV